ncbi:hypothetical protein MNBD_GAMMA21-582 [hydrothermal vent metagenome]|uniref:Integral membrane protein n=1 Tax=hydrothermal vent metagenome TaxID=652676 RepID=A0A3B0ZBR9_9ZZZZ
MTITSPEVICVDLDGTLVHTDTLYELCILALKQNLLLIFALPIWLFKGKAFFKAKLSSHAEIPTETLLYNDAVIEYLKNKKADGANIYLVTASHQNVANAVAKHLGFFADQFGSTEHNNIKGKNKADFLNARFGEFGYEYIGNDDSDLNVWESSSRAVVVSENEHLFEKAKKINKDVISLPSLNKSSLKSYFKLMRPHQWVKNVLILVPLVLSHSVTDVDKVLLSAIGFILFSLTASGIYVFNDLVDISNDRVHPIKSKRPIAAGEVSVLHGVVLGLLLWIISLSVAYFNFDFLFLILLGYIVLNFLYSFLLKRLVLVDVVVLAGFYIIRIITGAVIVKVALSFWLITFSLFMFFSLALAKRYSEIALYTRESTEVKGRGYIREDEFITTILGVASGLVSVLVMALYIHDDRTRIMYSDSNWLWITIPALLYWVSRLWLLAHRKLLAEDPIRFAIRDKESYLIFGVLLFSVFMAL